MDRVCEETGHCARTGHAGCVARAEHGGGAVIGGGVRTGRARVQRLVRLLLEWVQTGGS